MSERAEKFDINVEGESWFHDARREWTELLEQSTANPLFMSWGWQNQWWRHFGQLVGGDLVIITVRTASGLLVGVAPFFVRKSASRRIRTAIQLAPIGNVWRTNIGEVTEHTDWIIRRDLLDSVPRAITERLSGDLPWDEILVAYADPMSPSWIELHRMAEHLHCYVRRERPLRHYSVDTTVTFERFLEGLIKSTRRRLWSRRSFLEQLGTVRLVEADETNIDSQLDKLDALSRIRWGAGLSANLRNFYDNLSLELLRGGRLRFSTLEVDDQPISALLDIDAGNATYNVRSAIDAGFNKKISPGLLHLGYVIEHACDRQDTEQYALLAGRGKSADFKRDIAGVSGTFVSFQIVRRAHEKFLYGLYDRVMRSA